MNVTSSMSSFIDTVQESIKLGKSFKEIIENNLGIDSESLENIYLLKYYVELENGSDYDKVIKFINNIIDAYTKKSDIDVIMDIDDLNKETDLGSELKNMQISLMKNSGIEFSPIALAYYKDGKLIIGQKDIARNRDNSICMQIGDNQDLTYFKDEVFKKFGYLFSRTRGIGLKDKIDLFMDKNYFVGKDNSVLVIANIKNGVANYQFRDKSYSTPVKDEDSYFEQVEYEREDVFMELWVI